MLKKYQDIIHEKWIMLEILGNSFSRFGDGIDTIAFSILVYRITGSTVLVASIFAINGLPNIIFSLFSGVLSTKREERLVVCTCDLIRSISIMIVGVLYAFGNLMVWHLFVVTFINSTVETFRAPAATSLFGRIISADNTEVVISAKTTFEKAAEIIGLAIAPTICTALGLHAALLIDSVTFLVCAFFIYSIKVSGANANVSENPVELLKAGLFYLKGNKPLIASLIFTVFVNIIFVPINVFQVPLVETELGMSDYLLSVIGIMVSVSMAISAAIFPALKEKFSDIFLFRASGMAMALSYIIVFSLQYGGNLYKTIGMVVAMLLLGSGVAQVSILMQTLFFKVVDEEYIARMGAVSAMAAYCVNPIFSSLFGGISVYTSILNIFFMCAIMAVLIFAITRDFLSN